MSTPEEHLDVVVGEDGSLAAVGADELARLGVRPGEHLQLVRTASRVSETGLAEKRPPFRSVAGSLAGVVPELTWEDFEAASRLAIADVEAGPTYPLE